MSLTIHDPPEKRRGPPKNSYDLVISNLKAAKHRIRLHDSTIDRYKREIASRDTIIANRTASLIQLRDQFATAASIVAFQGITDSTTCTSRRGAMSELIACVWLMSQNYEVFRAVHPDGFADLIAYKAGGFILVDVKTRSKYNKTHKILSERQIEAGVRLLTVNLETGQCTLHPPKVHDIA